MSGENTHQADFFAGVKEASKNVENIGNINNNDNRNQSSKYIWNKSETEVPETNVGPFNPYKEGLSRRGRKWFNFYQDKGFEPTIARQKAITHMDIPPHLKHLVESTPQVRLGSSDDPFIKGLSTAEVRRYRRYVREGNGPYRAIKLAIHEREKVVDHLKKIDDEKKMPIYKILHNAKQNIIFQESIRLAALPKDYPNNMLTFEELEKLKKIIEKKIKDETVLKLQFNGIYGKDGLLLFDSINHTTAEWVQIVIPELIDWQGTPLYTCCAFEIPQAHIIELLLPKSAGQDVEKTLSLISKQNEGIDTKKWKVISCASIDDSQLLIVRVDLQTIASMKNNKNCIAYKLSKVNIRGLTYMKTENSMQT